MSHRDGFEPGVPSWVSVMQADLEAGAAFYGGLLGWEFENHGVYLMARKDGRDVAAITPLPPGSEDAVPPSWVTSVEVEDAAAAAAAARAAGGTVVMEMVDAPLGSISVLTDPTGATLVAKEADRHAGAQVVNEPGAWSMSQLATPDPDAAAAFYGAVFGWTTESFGEATMFRLPGYVGGEPEQPVSREVVAVMVPGDAGAGWTPDFWVGDVDDAAQAAGSLGGRVLAGPFDNPVGRTVVLADPAEAVFTVSEIAALKNA